MQPFFQELPVDYSSYNFPYRVWAEKESGDSLTDLLSAGFLPARKKINLFYLARSLRIDLSKFKISSENRRIRRKTTEFGFAVVGQREFKLTGEIMEQIIVYSKKAYQGGALLSASSVKRIFSRYLCSAVLVWLDEAGQKIGYAPVWADKQSAYYWGGFIDPKLKVSGLGVRMMLEAITWAKKEGRQFVYLGTIYTESALYKTNFADAEWFDGRGWSQDLNRLKELIKK